LFDLTNMYIEVLLVPKSNKCSLDISKNAQ